MMLTKFINASLGFATRAERGRAVFLGGRSPDFAEEILRLRNERHQVAPKTSALDAGGDKMALGDGKVDVPMPYRSAA